MAATETALGRLLSRIHPLLNDVIKDHEENQRTNPIKDEFAACPLPTDTTSEFHDASLFVGAKFRGLHPSAERIEAVLALAAAVRFQ